jgi:hypothetical protein
MSTMASLRRFMLFLSLFIASHFMLNIMLCLECDSTIYLSTIFFANSQLDL